MFDLSHNSYIVDFYTKHPNWSFEKVNVFIITLLSSISEESSQDNQNEIFSKVINTITEMKNDMSNLKSQISILNEKTNVSEVAEQIISEFSTKISTSELQTNQQMKNLIEKENDNMLAKLSNSISSYIPQALKNSEKEFQLINNQNSTSFKNIIDILDSNKPVPHNIIQSMFTDYTSSIQSNISFKFSEVNQNISDLVFKTDNVLDKFKNSSLKGQLSENALSNVISRLFPSAEIIETRNIPESGDFIIKAEEFNKAVLIENKDYINNVPTDEVNKFIRDVQKQNAHGIFFSQSSGIVNKHNFHIDILDDSINVYVHNVGFRNDIILPAFEIIQQLQHLVQSNTTQENHVITVITTTELTQINDELKLWNKQSDEHVSNLQKCIKHMQLSPSVKLQEILMKHFGTPAIIHCCPKCQKKFKNRAGLASHMKSCKKSEENTISM